MIDKNISQNFIIPDKIKEKKLGNVTSNKSANKQ